MVAINGTEVTGTARLQEIMARLSPGDTINIVYVRDGKRGSVTTTLRNRAGNTDRTRPQTPLGVLGGTFTPLSDQQKRSLEVSNGVQVKITDREAALASAGVNDGFIILSINNIPIASAEDVEKIFNQVREQRDKVLFLIGLYPSGKQAYYAVDLSDQ